MQQSVEVLDQQKKASIEFGRDMHQIAVHVKGKTELARRIGQPKAFIKEVTAGDAYKHERQLLVELVLAVPELHPTYQMHLLRLIVEIKPSS